MKKITLVLFVLLGLFVFPLKVHAVDYTIEKTDIHAYLQTNGDVKVEEMHTYEFDGEFNGITRTLIPKDSTQILDVQATENGSQLKVVQEDNLYKVYRGGTDETITVQLTYTIKNGVDLYTDMAQLYWPFFDESNESDYENLNVYVHPPEPVGDVVFLGYDAAWETGEADSSGVVHFNMGYVNSGTNGDVRVAYDQALFSGAPLAANRTIRDDIVADKEQIEADKAAFQQRKNMLDQLAPYVLAGFGLYLIILILRARIQKHNVNLEVDRQFVADFFVPKLEISMPATIQYMKGVTVKMADVSAALLDLVRQGYVERVDDETFKLINRQVTHDHEHLLINWLFGRVGNGQTFSFNDLERYTNLKTNHEQFRDDLRLWRQAIQGEVKQAELYQNKTGYRWFIALSSLLLLPLAVTFIIYDLLLWMLIALLLMGVLIVFAVAHNPRTVKGMYIKRQWDSFKETFSEITPDQWEDWHDDDQKRAFIYGVGSSDKVIMDKNEAFVEQYAGPRTSYSDMYTFLLIASLANMHFGKADTVAAATISSSGGTPGGGAGVGGGGGGSGAF
ncbi:DUF2207 domain-containing protein [Lentibacillus saliphilus]|uniref:DUF2207 domain-containing protein n=1 Tax=Lentibacillus saliphilus TaxID=2737028 RepID=UPI001C2FD001|nr:DUF2207 domain-containing protein [Lentibacillus saliphilus]